MKVATSKAVADPGFPRTSGGAPTPQLFVLLVPPASESLNASRGWSAYRRVWIQGVCLQWGWAEKWAVRILLECILVTAHKRSLWRLCFYRCLSVHRGGWLVWLLGGCVCGCQGGMHGCQGVCMVAGGHAWLLGGVCGCQGHVWLLGGMHGCQGDMHGCRGHAWLAGGVHDCWGGACMVAGWGACMVKGGCMVKGAACFRCVWWRGACVVKGACVVGGACVGYDKIRRYDQWAGGTHPTGMHSC